MRIKKVAILGSTGSIGINALKVIDHFPRKFKIIGLTAYNNVRLLERQIKKYRPTHVAVNSGRIKYLKRNVFSHSLKVFDAREGIQKIASLKEVDIVVLGIGGSAALDPFLEAVRSGKIVAPANKEAIVMAGPIIMREAKKHGAVIIPVDSEQSAIFQCLKGNDRRELKRIFLTASGGPLCNTTKKKFAQIGVSQILRHPRWKMGKKITVDSATLMNKGLEVIEAKCLFDLDVKDIEVLIHPQAIIHSMVEFKDGSILAQLGITDMRLPIQYALTYPVRVESGLDKMNFCKLGQLTFKKPDVRKFPSLRLCFRVAQSGGTLPSVLNAVNEETVDAFLNGQIHFTGMYRIVEKIVSKHKKVGNPSLKQICESDHWAREEVRRILKN